MLNTWSAWRLRLRVLRHHLLTLCLSLCRILDHCIVPPRQ